MLHLFCQDQLGGWVQVKMKEKILALRCIYTEQRQTREWHRLQEIQCAIDSEARQR